MYLSYKPQSEDINGDVLLSHEEANADYRSRAGAPLTADASKVKFRILAHRGNGLYLTQSIGYSQFETYDKVDLVKSGSGWFVLPKTYDFDINGGLGNLAGEVTCSPSCYRSDVESVGFMLDG